MKKIAFLLLCALLGLPQSADARKKKQTPPPAAAPKAEQPQSVRHSGLFGVEKQTKKDAVDYFLTIPDSIVGRQILATVRYIATPGGTDQYGGEQFDQQVVYFERAADNRLLMRASVLINHADSADNISQAVRISNANPIIGAFKVEGREGKASKIKVTQFFNEENSAFGTNALKRQFSLSRQQAGASYIDTIKTFPMNTEVHLVKTFDSAAGASQTTAGWKTGRVTFDINISFVLLPETPMLRRTFDPRVGYFADSFNEYSDNQQRVSRERFITRWRLEPKTPEAADSLARGFAVEPKKPIVYYIDPATPAQWVPYLIKGVEDWQEAFEGAGFKNAILAREWPKDSTMSMEDARFSVIRYLASPIANAYGPNVHDPRSGEIIESHICWYHNVMKLVHDWYMIQAGTIDEAARKMNYDTELMGQLIRFVSSHEVGHTLGLRHNFGSSSTVPVDSLRNKAWVEAHGHTPSIMDYARFNYVAQPEDNIAHEGIFPRIGDYDKWAIRWGYRPMTGATDAASDHRLLEPMTREAMASSRRLWFGDGETYRFDPRCQTEDLGDDAVKASHYGILNLKREMKRLPEWTFRADDIYSADLTDMYSEIVGQFLRYTGHVMAWIGGVEKNYRTVDESPADCYTVVPRARQLECLDFIDSHVFDEPVWLRDEPFVMRLGVDPMRQTARVGQSVVNALTGNARLARLTGDFTAADLLGELTARLFLETRTGSAVVRYRRTLQTAYVQSLCNQFGELGLGEVRSALLQNLRQLKTRLSSACSADAATSAHYAALADQIERTLAVK